jgi:hypothetical protein
MPSEQNWYLPEHILYVRFYGHLSVEDIQTEFARSVAFVEASSAKKVHFLHDWQAVETFPRDLLAIRRVLKMRVTDPSKIGWVVVYGSQNPVLRFLGDVLFQTFKIQFRVWATQAEALAFLQTVDDTLPAPLETVTSE